MRIGPLRLLHYRVLVTSLYSRFDVRYASRRSDVKLCVFDMQCMQKGREEELVFALMRKAMEHALRPKNFNNVRTVFSTPKLPGYIFFEAPSKGVVFTFVQGIVGVYKNTCDLVPIEGRVQLLKSRSERQQGGVRRIDGTKGLLDWYWVTIRGGLHDGDVGLVVDGFHSTETVAVKVVPRIDDPRTSPARLPPFEALSCRKKKQRSPQRLRDIAQLRLLFGDTAVETTSTGFLFNGWHFSSDCFWVIRLPTRRVVEFHLLLEQVAIFSDRVVLSDSKEHPLPSFRIPNLISVGCNVEVMEGELQGRTAAVIAVSNKCTISVSFRTEEDGASLPMTIELSINSVQITFNIGDHVVVRLGRNKGLCGIVCGVNKRVIELLDDGTKEVVSIHFPSYGIVRSHSRRT